MLPLEQGTETETETHTSDIWEIIDPKAPEIAKLIEVYKDEYKKPITPEEYLSNTIKYSQSRGLEVFNPETINDKFIGFPMNPTCICSVVIPAYNENNTGGIDQNGQTNIANLVEYISKQDFSPEGSLKPENFEVIIVVNNSNDQTEIAALDKIKEINPKIPIHILNVEFPEEFKGAGSARKVGCDLSIYRVAQIKGKLDQPYYFINLDADNMFPSNHFESIINTFNTTDYEILTGSANFDESIVLNVLEKINLGKLFYAIKDLQQYAMENYRDAATAKYEIQTVGANQAFTAEFYLKMRGFPPGRRVGEDVYPGRVARALDSPIGRIESDVIQNPRRLYADVRTYMLGGSWNPSVFDSQHERVRSINPEDVDINLTREDMVLFTVRKTDEFAANFFENENTNWMGAVRSTRAFLKQSFLKHGMTQEDFNFFVPDNLFFLRGKKVDKLIENNDIRDYLLGDEIPDGFKVYEFSQDPEAKRAYIRRIEDTKELVQIMSKGSQPVLKVIRTARDGLPEITY